MSKRRDRVLAAVMALGASAVMIGAIAHLVWPVLRPYAPGSASDNQTAQVEPRPELGAWGREEVIRMAGRIALAEFSEKTVMPPALELQREKSQQVTAPTSAGTRVVTGFECSVPLDVKPVSDSHVKLRILTEGYRNWFMFRVEGVPAGGKTLRIDLDFVNLGKWRTLNPVYSYCNSLDDLAAFEASPSNSEPVAAHNGPLLPDTSGQQWHYIPATWSEGSSTLSFVHHYERDAFVAMRVPYTPKYNEAFLASLRGMPNVEVITIGESPQGRPLQLVKISAGEEAERKNPCVLIYAREHPSEQDSSWAVEGAIRFLMSDDRGAHRLRERCTFLLLPMLDPDGAAVGLYERITYSFRADEFSPEAVSYANWFESWINAEKRIDVALNLHNVESAESEHLYCYFAEGGRMDACRHLHAAVLRTFQAATGKPYRVGANIRGGNTTTRLSGWLGYYLGPLPMLYETNSQEKERHLSLVETRDIGRLLTLATADYLASDRGASLMSAIDRLRASRVEDVASAADMVGANAIVRARRPDWESITAAEHEHASPRVLLKKKGDAQ